MDWLELLPLTPLAIAALTLEFASLKKAGTNFSLAFIFYLLAMVLGHALFACTLLMVALVINLFSGSRDFTVLSSCAIIAIPTAIFQWSRAWPEAIGEALPLVLGVILSWNIVHSLFCWQKIEALGEKAEQRERSFYLELLRLRGKASSFAFIALVLPAENAWALLFALPLCHSITTSAQNMDYRIHHSQSTRAKEKAQVAEQKFLRREQELSVTGQKHELLDKLVERFSKDLSPSQAFQELHRATAEVVDYQSMVLFLKNEESGFHTSVHNFSNGLYEFSQSPHPSLQALLQKCWDTQRPVQRKISVATEQGGQNSENCLVATPARPLGIIYFGKTDQSSFSKKEASQLWYLVKKALPSILKVQEKAQTQAALRTESKRGARLQKQVRLSSQLLTGAQRMLSVLKMEQCFQILEELLLETYPDSAGMIVSQNKGVRIHRAWGRELQRRALPKLLNSGDQETQVQLIQDLRQSDFPELTGDSSSLLSVAYGWGKEYSGFLLHSQKGEQGPEEREFVQTCACLLDACLASLKFQAEADKAYEQVVQASKHSAIAQLANGVAHQLNTPLATISVALEMAQARPQSAAEKLTQASEANSHAQEIVAALLTYSRDSDEDREMIEPKKAVQMAVQLASELFEKSGIVVKLETPETEGRVFAYPPDLHQLLLNLIQNAIDASQAGDKIFLFTRQDGVEIEFGVQDWGEGIAETEIQKIFEPFVSHRPMGSRAGLGLSVCRQLVERHHGTLRCHSVVGEGSTFIARFPSRKPD